MGIVRSRGTEHSRKPEELYTEIERLFEGHRCELFAREERSGWDAWGLEAGKFNTLSPAHLAAEGNL
jgi:N6-adenosine-specific RNA methylase IME4